MSASDIKNMKVRFAENMEKYPVTMAIISMKAITGLEFSDIIESLDAKNKMAAFLEASSGAVDICAKMLKDMGELDPHEVQQVLANDRNIISDEEDEIASKLLKDLDLE